jgi:hypothetical protein
MSSVTVNIPPRINVPTFISPPPTNSSSASAESNLSVKVPPRMVCYFPDNCPPTDDELKLLEQLREKYAGYYAVMTTSDPGPRHNPYCTDFFTFCGKQVLIAVVTTCFGDEDKSDPANWCKDEGGLMVRIR